MLLKVTAADQSQQTVIVQGQEIPVNKSGGISATGTAQTLIAANAFRSGWMMQNKGSNVMHINIFGAATSGGGSFAVPVQGCFPPAGFPITMNAISILGTIGDVYTAMEW
jgi:hypothetical protein